MRKFRRRSPDDFKAEVAAHLALEAEQLRAEGATHPEAAAERAFGNVLAVEERQYESTRWLGLDHAAQDVRFAVRMLRHSMALTVVAVLTLGFGIGAITAVYTTADALVLHALPYPASGRLMAIESREALHPENPSWMSMAAFEELRARTHSFDTVAGVSPVWNMVASGRSNTDAERLQILYVSANFMPILGVRPELGRGFTDAEDNRGTPARVVMLSDAYWRRAFGGSAAVLGKAVILDTERYTIVGVLPAGFHYLGEPIEGTDSAIDAWLPLGANELANSPRTLRFLKVVARLRPGATVAAAKSEVRKVGEAFARDHAESDAGLVYNATPLSEQVAARVRPGVMLLLAAVALILLLACVNAAQLQIARAAVRRPELAVRIALGATHGRLLRQLLTESVVLAAAGGAAGLAVAVGGIRALTALAPPSLMSGRAIALDGRALTLAGAAVVVSALGAGLPPALVMLRRGPAGGLRDAGRTATGAHHGLRSTLVVAQMALTLMLLAGAGLLLRTFLRLLQVNPGFDAATVVTLSTQLHQTAGVTREQAITLDHRLLDDLGGLPGVTAVGAVSRLPLLGESLTSTLWIEGRIFSAAEQPGVEYRVASNGYFAAMGIPLLEGRAFDARDTGPAAARVAVLDAATARLAWPGANAVGRRIKLGPDPDRQPWITVVGVVGDVHHFGLDTSPAPEVYRPLDYSALVAPIVVARVSGEPSTVLAALDRAVHKFDPAMPVYDSFPMEALLRRSLAQRRFLLLLLASFAAAALFLAGVGVYAAAAQSVTERTREIGIRLALGASPRAVLWLVLAQGARLTLVGAAAGVAGAALGTRLMAALLFQVSPRDPAVFSAAVTVLASAALAATLVPALRATRIDPQATLRGE